MRERVAILGGGQSGYFLSKAAKDLNLETVVVTPDLNSPATHAADRCVQSRFDSPEWLPLLAIQDATVTFELDDVSPELLHRLETTGNQATLAQVRTLKLLQDKTAQKQWLKKQGFQAAEAVACDGEEHIARAFAEMHGYPIVQKLARGGYDGRGVKVIHSEDELEHLWHIPSLVEAFVPHAQELTVLVARNMEGEVVGYDPVATFFNEEGHVLDYLIAPAPLPADVSGRARLLAETVIGSLEGVGIYAVELFLTTDNRLLVNEISARVHNTGTHTLETTETSQYEQHLRAITGRPLGSTKSRAPVTVMRNLLNGVNSLAALENEPPQEKRVGNAVLHWYGKAANRHLRKLGHITATGDTLEEAWQALADLEVQLGGSAQDQQAA